jgi:hypothetical protein
MSGSIEDEASPFNEGGHGYLEAIAILVRIRELRLWPPPDG